jgi:drug/metabolite transporter (DMT)-like permease
VLGGDNGLHYDEIINNITTSPLSYFLAFIGAFIWAAYCTVTNKYARGFNGITVFVLLTGASLWVYYFLTPQPEMVFSTPVQILKNCLRLTSIAFLFFQGYYCARKLTVKF